MNRWQYLIIVALLLLLALALTYTGEVIEQNNIYEERVKMLNALLFLQQREHEAELQQVNLEWKVGIHDDN